MENSYSTEVSVVVVSHSYLVSGVEVDPVAETPYWKE
jgi:hypothetical protein